MNGKLRKLKKGYAVVWRKKGEKQDTPTDIDGQAWQSLQKHFKQLPTEGKDVDIIFQLKKNTVDFATIRPAPAAAQKVKLTLPVRFAELNSKFDKLKDDKQKENVLACIERRIDITKKDVETLLDAVQQDFPLGITKEKFEEALMALVVRQKRAGAPTSESPRGLPTHLTGLTMTDDDVIQIMIHGSSVSGLRLKKKEEKKGWSFDDKLSDYDVSIIDHKRFCWAQALGITTYGDNNTIELSDEQLHLLKLYKFCGNLRAVIPQRPVNFCIYANLESAKQHSGYSLLCKYTKAKNAFVVERLFTPELEKQVDPDKSPQTLQVFLNETINILRKEEVIATNTVLQELMAKEVKPGQGNHLFNDIPATLDTLLVSLQKVKDTWKQAPKFGTKFVDEYCTMLTDIQTKLCFISREEADAQRVHGGMKHVIQKGFEYPSDGRNDRLYGNAVAYFWNCSLTIVDLALRCYGSPKKVSFIVPPLEKSFANLLRCAVDIAVCQQIVKHKDNKNCVYANDQLTTFNETQKVLVSRFKEKLRILTLHLTYERIFAVEGLEALTALDLDNILSEFDTGHDWYLGSVQYFI